MLRNPQRRGRLSAEETTRVKALILKYFQDHDRITNIILRELSGITYNQAGYFFKDMTNQNVITRWGITANIHYTLNSEPSNKIE